MVRVDGGRESACLPNGAWLLAQKQWIVPIPGTSKLHRLEENIAAADVELTPDELREIEEAQIDAHGARYSEANQRMIDR